MELLQVVIVSGEKGGPPVPTWSEDSCAVALLYVFIYFPRRKIYEKIHECSYLLECSHSANIWVPDLCFPTFRVGLYRMDMLLTLNQVFTSAFGIVALIFQHSYQLLFCTEHFPYIELDIRRTCLIPRCIIMWLQKSHWSLFPYVYKINNIPVFGKMFWDL